MMKATLSEHIGDRRISSHEIDLDSLESPITIGRGSGDRHIRVGVSNEFLGISRTQATILIGPPPEVIDGAVDRKSQRGIYLHGIRQDRIPLRPGIEVEIFNNGEGSVILFCYEESADARAYPTAQQEDLIVAVREQVGVLRSEITEVREAIASFAGQMRNIHDQLAAHKAADDRQDKKISRLVVGVLGAIAGLCVVWWGAARIDIDPLISVAIVTTVGGLAKVYLDKRL
jgi:hypothetical protein